MKACPTWRGVKAGLGLAGVGAWFALAGQPISFSAPKTDIETPAKARQAELLEERRQRSSSFSDWAGPSQGRTPALPLLNPDRSPPSGAQQRQSWLWDDKETQLDRLSGQSSRRPAKRADDPWGTSDRTVERVFGVSSDQLLGRSSGSPARGSSPGFGGLGSRSATPARVESPGERRRSPSLASEDSFGLLGDSSRLASPAVPPRARDEAASKSVWTSAREAMGGERQTSRTGSDFHNNWLAVTQVKSLFDAAPAASPAVPGQPLSLAPPAPGLGGAFAPRSDNGSAWNGTFGGEQAPASTRLPTMEQLNQTVTGVNPSANTPAPQTADQLRTLRLIDHRTHLDFPRPRF